MWGFTLEHFLLAAVGGVGPKACFDTLSCVAALPCWHCLSRCAELLTVVCCCVLSGLGLEWLVSIGAAGGLETRLTAPALFLLSMRQRGAAAGVDKQHRLADSCLHVPTEGNIVKDIFVLCVE